MKGGSNLLLLLLLLLLVAATIVTVVTGFSSPYPIGNTRYCHSGSSSNLSFLRLHPQGHQHQHSHRLDMSTTSSDIVVISQPDSTFLEQKGVWDWDIWGCPASKFPWTYGSSESCYILQGQVTVTPTNGQSPPATFGKGDYVTFPAGMSCTWDVKEAVKKHYMFH